jgi:hypothetical protein
MRKAVIILSILALIAGGCGQATKQQAENRTIDPDSIQTINETCLTEKTDKKSLLFEETKELMLNNKNHQITFKYYLNEFSNSDYKQTSLSVYFDDKEIYEINNYNIGLVSADPDPVDERENAFNKNATEREIIQLIKRINPYGIKDNFTTITSDDGREYLLFTIRDIGDSMFAISNSFINDNGDVLHNEWNNLCVFDVFEDSITDANYIREEEKQPFYIKDNKYYRVEMECSWEDDYEEGEPYSCKIYEKTITVKRNKVKEEMKEMKTITLYDIFCP